MRSHTSDIRTLGYGLSAPFDRLAFAQPLQKGYSVYLDITEFTNGVGLPVRVLRKKDVRIDFLPH